MTYEEIIELARQHDPGADAVLPGFETRLSARIRELRTEAETAGVFASWFWRASLGLTPVATAVAVFLLVSHGFSLPDGADSLLGQLTTLLPGVEY